MSSTFGKAFRVHSWGESHGKAIGCTVEGCPSGLVITPEDIQVQLDRRRPGQSKVTTTRDEADRAEILSGVFENKTLGTPISILVRNRDADSTKYEEIRTRPRPGHADYTWPAKFGHFDWRGGGRASARETVARVAAGAIARKLIRTLGIKVIAYTVRIGHVTSKSPSPIDPAIESIIESNAVRAPDPRAAEEMEGAILQARKDGDSLGGVVEVIATGVPPGLGEPVFDKLDALIAHALMSIPATKGVEIGAGFALAEARGSDANDCWVLDAGGKPVTETNNAGGILGGISNGMPIVARAVFKPTSSIARAQKTVDLETLEPAEILVRGRHDPCVVPRAVPIVEAMICLVLADCAILQGLLPRQLKPGQ